MIVVGRQERVGIVGCCMMLLLSACDTQPAVRAAEGSTLRADSAERTRQDSIVRSQPGYVVDSILPVDEEIRRFQATVGDTPNGFRNGASSRSALVQHLVDALERNDTTALASLVVDRGEFAFLIYPSSPNSAPPYKQSPEVVWFMRSAGSAKGAERLLTRFGGQPLRYAGTACAASAERQGSNTLWNSCTVARLGPGGDTTRLTMFGAIIERGGRFKFLSLANGL